MPSVAPEGHVQDKERMAMGSLQDLDSDSAHSNKKGKTISARNDASTSITRELLDWMLVPLLVLCPLTLLVSYFIARDLANEVFDRNLIGTAHALAEQIAIKPVGDLHGDRRGEGEIYLAIGMKSLLPDADVDSHAFRLDSAERLLLGTEDLPAPPPSLFKHALKATAPSGTTLRDGRWGDDRVRIAVIVVPPEKFGRALVMQVAETKARSELLVREILLQLLPLQMAILAFTTLLAWIGVRQGIKPLLRLSAELQARQPGDLRPIEPTLAPAEIAPLVHDFNHLIANAKDEAQRQQRLIDSAAHQLRTPLAGLSLTTELALRSNDPAAQRAALVTIAQSTKQAARAINQLLLLRMDHREWFADTFVFDPRFHHALQPLPFHFQKPRRCSAALVCVEQPAWPRGGAAPR